MLSNQNVTLSVNTTNDFQITSQQVEEDLKNPNSPLYQALYNKRMNELTHKKAIRKVEYQYIISQELQRQIDKLEDELAQQRELAYAQNRDSLKQYYAEQHKLVMEVAGLPNNSPKTSTETSLLEHYVKQLIAKDAQLYFLKNQRENILQNYAEKQKVYANAFIAELNSQFNLDAETLPEKVKEIDNQVIEQMTERKHFDETLEKLGSKHPINAMIEAEKEKGSTKLYEARREFHIVLTSIILRPSAKARFEEIAIQISEKKRFTNEINNLVNQTMLVVEALNPDNQLAQNEKATAQALAERMFIQNKLQAGQQAMDINKELEVEVHSSFRCGG